ncbi:hypothetical protein FQA39_LY08771 [Lamprigera yunnana]|nr:hypothetical protein FQA39_LY08771 [Lamprigera yunnana]
MNVFWLYGIFGTSNIFPIIFGFQITINIKNNSTKFKHFWESTGFCPLGPTMELHRYLLATDEKLNIAYIGALPNNSIKEIRIHWLLNLLSMKNINGVVTYNFTHLDNVLDWIKEQKLYPRFELMGLPQIVSKGVIHDKRSYNFWYNITLEIATRYIDRYGLRYFKKWRFETWNEPDLASYNILNFTLPEYLTYVEACADGLQDSFIFNNVTEQILKFGGPAGLFKDLRKHPLCWGLLRMCNKQNRRKKHGCPLNFISFHKKGDGSAYEVLNNTLQLLNDVHRRFPKVRKIPIANDEADILTNWSKSMEWRADVRYAAMMAKLVIDYFKVLIINMSVSVELLGFDNAFLNYHPYYFTQRTLLARFQMNNTNPSHIQFIKKPAYSVMGLLSMLGDEYLKEDIMSSDPLVQFLVTRSVKNKNEFQVSLLIIYVNDAEEDNKDIKTINVVFNEKFNDQCKYAIYLLDNTRTNPFSIWKNKGSSSFPTKELRQQMREVEEPYRLKRPSFILTSPLTLKLNLTLPSVALINICSRSSQPPGRVTHLTAHNITENEVLLVWKDTKVRSKCIRTYEVEFQLDANGSKNPFLFKRINERDTVFLSYQHVMTGNVKLHKLINGGSKPQS